eukprot:scaffold577747_cov15-Prasinocladus_malaysianus.AAC.1
MWRKLTMCDSMYCTMFKSPATRRPHSIMSRFINACYTYKNTPPSVFKGHHQRPSLQDPTSGCSPRARREIGW